MVIFFCAAKKAIDAFLLKAKSNFTLSVMLSWLPQEELDHIKQHWVLYSNNSVLSLSISYMAHYIRC